MSEPNSIADMQFRLEARDLWHDSQQFALSLRVPLEKLLGNSRKLPIVHARHAYWAWLHDQHGLGLSAIGRLLRRDHTTIMHGVDCHLNRQPRRFSDVVAEVTCKPKVASIVPRTMVPAGRMTGWDRAASEEAIEGGAHVNW